MRRPPPDRSRLRASSPARRLNRRPTPHYAGAEARPDVMLRRIADGQSLVLAFASGEVDMAFNLPVETLSMLETTDGKIVSFPVAYQYMMWMNTRTPVLSDPRVRRAIDLACASHDPSVHHRDTTRLDSPRSVSGGCDKAFNVGKHPAARPQRHPASRTQTLRGPNQPPNDTW